MNVLLVILDSVRARNTSLHGYERETTPFLEGLARDGHRYTQARSPGRWSIPSHASIFTGRSVREHGLTDRGHRLEPGTTVFHDLSEAGYDTGVFSKNSFLNVDDTGLAADFDTVVSLKTPPFAGGLDPGRFGGVRELLSEAAGHAPVRSLLNAAIVKASWDYPELVPRRVRARCPRLVPDRRYVDELLDWTEGRERWAACINLMGAHGPYEPVHDEWATPEARRVEREVEHKWEFYGDRPWSDIELLEDLYDGCIKDVDEDIRRLVRGLDARGQLEDTLVVITADHGEGFGEPDPLREDARVVGHGTGSHEHLFHVPLVVLPPDDESRTVTDPVSLTEFPAVVRRALDGEPPVFGDGDAWAFDTGIGSEGAAVLSEYVDDIERFRGHVDIRYRPDGDCVEKRAALDGRTVTERIEGTEVVDRSYGRGTLAVPFEPEGLVVDRDPDDVEETVRRDLEHLGYL